VKYKHPTVKILFNVTMIPISIDAKIRSQRENPGSRTFSNALDKRRRTDPGYFPFDPPKWDNSEYSCIIAISLVLGTGSNVFWGGGLRWMTKFVICACPASPPVGSAGAPLLNGQKPSCVVGEYCPNSKHGIGLMLSQLRNHKQENLIQGWVGRKVGKRTDYENKKKVRPSVSFWQREEEIRNGSRTPQPFFLLSIFISFCLARGRILRRLSEFRESTTGYVDFVIHAMGFQICLAEPRSDIRCARIQKRLLRERWLIIPFGEVKS
jgi:hypothetical protein